MKLWDKIKFNIALVLRSIIYAMKAGDNIITSKSGDGRDSEINQQVSVGGVMNDLLNQEETQQVKEIRDEYYRILNEADKYKVDVVLPIGEDGEISDNENDVIIGVARKKTASDFSQHCNVYEEPGTKLRVIQDNKHIEKDSSSAMLTFSSSNGVSLWDYETILDLDWDGMIPKFMLNKFVSKIVVRTVNNTDVVIDLYLPTIAGRFTKLDALMINELNKLFRDKEYKSDIKGLCGIEFITDKAWNSDNLCLFKYTDISFKDIIIYDGNFVLSFNGKVVSDGVSVTEKFRTEEVDKKYADKAPKNDATNIFAIQRQINGTDFGSTRLKIDNTNEDSSRLK